MGDHVFPPNCNVKHKTHVLHDYDDYAMKHHLQKPSKKTIALVFSICSCTVETVLPLYVKKLVVLMHTMYTHNSNHVNIIYI